MALVENVEILFNLNGERKSLRYRRLPFSVWSELKAQLKFTSMSLLEAWMGGDVEAVGAIIWLERRQSERTLRWPTVRAELERDECEFEAVGAGIDCEIEYLPGFGPDPLSDSADPTQASS
jgi:hypothetical protein